MKLNKIPSIRQANFKVHTRLFVPKIKYPNWVVSQKKNRPSYRTYINATSDAQWIDRAIKWLGYNYNTLHKFNKGDPVRAALYQTVPPHQYWYPMSIVKRARRQWHKYKHEHRLVMEGGTLHKRDDW